MLELDLNSVHALQIDNAWWWSLFGFPWRYSVFWFSRLFWGGSFCLGGFLGFCVFLLVLLFCFGLGLDAGPVWNPSGFGLSFGFGLSVRLFPGGPCRGLALGACP